MMIEIIRLSELPFGCDAVVESVNCAAGLQRRVMDMGIVKGTPIVPVLRAPFGDPVAYEAKNTLIALRERDCEDILVRWSHE